MQEANLTFVGDAALEYLRMGRQRAREGNRHPEFAPHGIYPCAGQERWVALACETEEQWVHLCSLAGHEDWLHDQRFRQAAGRKAHEDVLDAAIAAWTCELDRDRLVSRLTRAGVIAAPVLDSREVADDVHLRSRGMVVPLDHSEAGTWYQAANPLRFSRTPATDIRPAPLLGEHSWEVYSGLLTMPLEEYEALVALGVTGTGPPGQGEEAP